MGESKGLSPILEASLADHNGPLKKVSDDFKRHIRDDIEARLFDLKDQAIDKIQQALDAAETSDECLKVGTKILSYLGVTDKGETEVGSSLSLNKDDLKDIIGGIAKIAQSSAENRVLYSDAEIIYDDSLESKNEQS